MTEQKKSPWIKCKSNYQLIIYLAIYFAIYFIVSNIPAPEPMNQTSMQLLGIILSIVVGVCLMGPAIPGFLGLIMLGLSDVFVDCKTSFLTAFGNRVVIQVLLLMMFTVIMQKSGLAREIAERLISSKMARSPWRLTFFLMMATSIIAWFITGIPAMLIVWEIAQDIIEKVGYKKGDAWPRFIMIGICIAATMGMTVFPFQGSIAADMGILWNLYPDITLNPLLFILSGIVMNILFCLGMTVIGRVVGKPDVSPLKNFEPLKFNKLDSKKGRAIFLLILLVVLNVIPDFFAKGSLIYNMGAIGGTAICIVIALLMRNSDGTEYVSLQDMGQGVMWRVLIFIAAVNCMCGVLTSADLGIVTWMQGILAPVFQGMSAFGFYMAFTVIVMILTNLLDNAVVAFVTIPLMATIGLALDLPVATTMITIIHTVHYGMFLPGSTPNCTILYSKSEDGWYQKKDIMKYGAISLVFVLAIAAITYPLNLAFFH